MSEPKEKDLIAMYLENIKMYPLLTREEEQELAIQKELPTEEGRLARERLINSNLRLVVFIARKYVGRGVPLMDLIQEGNIGLMKAVDMYDYRKGCKLSGYAFRWIHCRLVKAIKNQGRTIRLPEYLQEKIWDVNKKKTELMQIYGRQLTLEELSDELDISCNKLAELCTFAEVPQSLEELLLEDTGINNIVDTNTKDPFDEFANTQMKEAIEDAMKILPAREAKVVRCLFGLEGEPMTMEQIGKLSDFGVSKERIRQIKMTALNRIRKEFGSELEDFLR